VLFTRKKSGIAASVAWRPFLLGPIFRQDMERQCAKPDADAVLAQATSADIKERLRRRGDEAFERGIFGAPTFLLGSEPYWGNDRLEDALASCVGSRSS
jgi:2-hydroxychromene-2-carboxylate isomerase